MHFEVTWVYNSVSFSYWDKREVGIEKLVFIPETGPKSESLSDKVHNNDN